MNKIKYFIIFLAILLFSLSVCAAADDTNITRQDTQHTIEDTYSYDNNVLIEKNDKDEEIPYEVVLELREHQSNKINDDQEIIKKEPKYNKSCLTKIKILIIN